MVRVIFDVNSVHLQDYQVGLGRVFEGYAFQRGRGQRGGGLGNILRSVWRMIAPLVKEAGVSLGREGLATTSRVLNNLNQTGNVKDLVLKETNTGIKNLVDKLQSGKGGIKRKKKAKKFHSYTNIKKKKKADKKKEDLFGFY